MKKTFQIEHPKHSPDRMFEGVRRDIKKYVKRERNKKLPEGFDFWDFDCKFGTTEAEAAVVHLAEFTAHIDAAQVADLKSFYVEILARPARRQKKPKD